MPQKVDFKDYDEILSNFDAFCDEFESRASNAFMRGDQNDGRVTEAQSRVGEPDLGAAAEIEAPGGADVPSGAPFAAVQETDP
jgi:hypothetical protein